MRVIFLTGVMWKICRVQLGVALKITLKLHTNRCLGLFTIGHVFNALASKKFIDRGVILNVLNFVDIGLQGGKLLLGDFSTAVDIPCGPRMLVKLLYRLLVVLSLGSHWGHFVFQWNRTLYNSIILHSGACHSFVMMKCARHNVLFSGSRCSQLMLNVIVHLLLFFQSSLLIHVIIVVIVVGRIVEAQELKFWLLFDFL